MITSRITLNLSNTTGIAPIVTLKQYDKTVDASGKQIEIILLNGSEEYTIPSDATVTIRATKPDLTFFDYEATFNGNTVTVNVQEQMTAVKGKYNANLRVSKGGNVIGSSSFIINVEENGIKDNTYVSTTVLQLIEQAGQNVNDIKVLYEATKKMFETMTGVIYPYDTSGLSKLEIELAARYETARTGKIFATRHQKFAFNTSSFGTKIQDSEGLVCEISTEAKEGRDDFEKYLPFQWEHCNYTRESDGTARPIALEGRPNYKTAGSVDVGCVSATFWWKWVEDDSSYTIYMSDQPHPEMGLVPWIEAVKADGTVLPFYVGSAFFSGVASDGKLRSQPNLPPAYNQSHNSQITDYQKKGAGYWGCGLEYITHGLIFSEIKFATPNVQKYSSGCTSYNFQTACALAETGVKRVLSTSAWSTEVGLCVSVGKKKGTDADRYHAELHSKADRVLVKSIEEITVGGVKYYALNLDTDKAFDTDADTIVSSMPCYTGDTEKIAGHHDGTAVNNGRHTTRIHGREYNAGQYFVPANCGLYAKDHKWHVYYAPKGMAHNTSLSGYTDGGIINIDSDGWIGDYKLSTNGTLAYPYSKGNGDSVGVGDQLWAGDVTKAADGTTRELLIGGALWNGSYAGLLSLYCGSRLGNGGWDCASRD